MITDAVTLAINAGTSSPAPVGSAVIDAVVSVTVRQVDDGASTFSIVLDADRAGALADELPVIADGTLAPGNRVQIAVQFRGSTAVLADGVIVNEELNFDASSNAFSYSVIGEDVSVYLRLDAKAAEWPGRSSAQIAREIIQNYAQYLTPTVVEPQNDFTPTVEQWVRQQNATDLSFLRALGRPFGYVFATRPGTTLGAKSVAYWGPPPRDGRPLPALTIETGAACNVSSLDFSYDAAAAVTVAGGSRVDADTFATQSIQSSTALGLKAFATSSSSRSPLKRTRRFVEPNLAGTLANAYADALAQTSARSAVRARAVVDTMDYGAVVTPASVIGVRGSGLMHSGLYYVERVDHVFARSGYRQELTLTREGVGSTVSRVTA